MIKRLLFSVLIFLFGALNAYPKCKEGYVHFWPDRYDVAINSIFIVEGYWVTQDVIRGLNKNHNVYLKSGKSIIPLEIVKINEGGYKLTQAILKPSSQLIEGEIYELQIDNFENINLYVQGNRKWKATKLSDKEAPQWTQKPTYLDKQKLIKGCGPESYVNFCVGASDQSAYGYLVKMTELEGNKISEYFIANEWKYLSIGHGMCFGEFNFKDNQNYEVLITPMDASGNKNENNSVSLSFVSPILGDTLINPETRNCKCNEVPKNHDWLTREVIIITLLFIIALAIVIVVYLKKRMANSI